MYYDFFGLREAPFNVTPDPRFVYFSKKHRQVFASLLYGIEQRKGFIEVTGEVGAGKTMLCRVLLRYLGDRVRSALIFNPTLSDSQLLSTIIEDFGIQTARHSRKDYFDALNRFLLEQAARGSTTVLILDEAQNFRPSALEQIRLLSNFETNNEKLLQIIMMGQSELAGLLARPSLRQLRQRITIWCHLIGMDEAESDAYICHRLRVAGIGGDRRLFDERAVALIHACSRGIPRVINVVCDKAMLVAYIMRQSVVTDECVKRALSELHGFMLNLAAEEESAGQLPTAP